MRHIVGRARERTRGYALLTVVVFTLVMTTAGAAFFTLSTYETRQSLYRQRSAEAFALADGAIERARAKLIEDRTWRSGWTDQGAGRGTYDLSIVDTTVAGEDVVRLVGTGTVLGVSRRVEAFARVPPSSYSYTLHILGDADVTGNLCLTGQVHVNGVGDFGSHDVHLQCGGICTDGFDVEPPPVYTDPGHFPGTTYYYVKGTKVGHSYQAAIFDGAGNDITAAVGNDLSGVTSYSGGNYTFDFSNTATLNLFFNDAAGVFRRAAGTSAVIVNFGDTPLFPVGGNGVANIVLDANSVLTLEATIVNTRFTGASASQRLDTQFWRGGTTTVRQLTFAPRQGVALIAYDYQKQGNANVTMGTDAAPALVYVTGDVPDLNSNYDHTGSMIVLGDYNSTGGPDITFHPGFIPNLPDYLESGWTPGVSGTLKIRLWREVANAGG